MKSFFDNYVVEALRAASGGYKARFLAVEKVEKSKFFDGQDPGALDPPLTPLRASTT